MIESIICCILVLSLANFYLSYYVGIKTVFDRVYNIALLVIFIHAIHVLVCELVFPLQQYIEYMAPFGLIYGPLCYFLFYTVSLKVLSKQRVLLHIAPFLFWLLIYLLIIASKTFHLKYFTIADKWLYICIPVSLIGYTGVLLLYKNTEDKKIIREGKKLVLLILLLVFVVGILITSTTYAGIVSGKEVDVVPIRIILYLVMFTIIALAFRYNASRIINGNQQEAKVQELLEKPKYQPYHKSALPEELLSDYQQKLETMMLEHKSYLDPELTLEKLAALMGIPKHYLTQVLNLRVGKNFYQYINVFRVLQSCELLKEGNGDFKLEEIAFQSGFNSKTSFNRYFKIQIGCTPSEYKERISA